MNWDQYLLHVDDVVERASAALAGGHLLTAAAMLKELDGERRGLPALSKAETDRARATIARLADLDEIVRTNLRRLDAEAALLRRGRASATGSQYVDTTA